MSDTQQSGVKQQIPYTDSQTVQECREPQREMQYFFTVQTLCQGLNPAPFTKQPADSQPLVTVEKSGNYDHCRKTCQDRDPDR